MHNQLTLWSPARHKAVVHHRAPSVVIASSPIVAAPFKALAAAKPTAPSPEVREELASRARRAFFDTRSTAFKMLAREAHGVNDKNRAAIISQAEAAGREAAATIYALAGYRRCIGTNCDRLCTPGYVYCPKCAN